MKINYEWSFGPFDCDPTNNIVKVIHWRLYGTYKELTAEAYGTVTLEEVIGDTFINFEDLTETTVKKWVTSKVDVAAMQAAIKAQIEHMLEPKSVTLSPPWA
jgi:hypothetical protein